MRSCFGDLMGDLLRRARRELLREMSALHMPCFPQAMPPGMSPLRSSSPATDRNPAAVEELQQPRMPASPWSYGGTTGTGSPQQRNVATCKRTLGLSSQSLRLRWASTFRLQCRVRRSPRSFAAALCRPRLRSRKSPTPSRGSLRAPLLGSPKVPWKQGKNKSQGVSYGKGRGGKKSTLQYNFDYPRASSVMFVLLRGTVYAHAYLPNGLVRLGKWARLRELG